MTTIAQVLTHSEKRIEILTASNVARKEGRMEDSVKLWKQYVQLCKEEDMKSDFEICSKCFYIGNVREFVLHPRTKDKLCLDCKYTA
jgi:hypothetical protein